MAGASSRIYKTNTAGVFSSWSAVSTTSWGNTAVQINGISTLDGTTVFAVGNGGYVFKYDGTSWTQLYTSLLLLSSPPNLYSLSLTSNNELFIYGSINFVAKSINGGTSWSQLSVFTSGSTTISTSTRPPHAISMLTSSVVFVGSVSGALRQTVTSGVKWTDSTTLASAAGRMILSVDIFSSNVGVAGK